MGKTLKIILILVFSLFNVFNLYSADSTLPNLTEQSSPADGDWIYTSDTSNSNASRKISINTLLDFIDAGNLPDLSSVYEPADAAITKTDEAETISANWVNTANPWADNEVSDTLTSSTCTGNSATATALAANGANAAAGNAILGVDASGAAEGAFDVWTEAENTAAGYISATLTQEEVEDYAGALITDGTGTHTRVTITYQDATGDIDFVVDDMNDDIPEAGDFGAATDLDANGAVAWGNLAEGELTNDSIIAADLKISNAETNGYALTSNTATGGFTWVELTGGAHDAATLDANAETLLSLTGQEFGLDTQTANKVFSGPVSGGVAVPTFRSLVADDIPEIPASTVTIIDGGSIITATEVEGALQENRNAIDLNTSKATNATHTGEVTGATTLTVDPTSISNKADTTIASADYLLFWDATDSALKKVDAGELLAGSGDLLADGSVPLTANWDVGNYDLTMKAATGDGTATFATFNSGGFTASEILGTDASKNIISLAVATYPSLAELAYVKGVTSAIQTQIDTKGAHAGQVWTGVQDFGGATSTEVENSAGDIILAELGAIGVDTTQKQLAVYDGIEKVIPLNHILQGSLGTGAYDTDPDVWIMELKTSVFPDGIVITGWEVKCNEADPTTELNANLYYCDDNDIGAFPGANATLVDVIDTTTGNSSEATMSNSDLGSGIIPAGKILYVVIDADLVSDTTLFPLLIEYYIPES